MQDVKSLTDAGDFGSFGRYEEVPIARMAPEMKEAYEYTMQLRGIVPGPHKIWLANAALSQTIVPVGAYYQKESSLTKAEIEIVTVLTNARWHSAYGTYEHEKIAEKLGHIPAKTTECLIAGLPSEIASNALGLSTRGPTRSSPLPSRRPAASNSSWAVSPPTFAWSFRL
jgi:4-carboxymuconolactone decarboxylase